MSTSLFTSYLTARWRITLSVGAVLLFLIALNWQYDVPGFDSSEDGTASRYLQGLTGKISDAFPDWGSSNTNGEVIGDWDGYDEQEPAPPKEHAVPTTGTSSRPEAKPSAVGSSTTVTQGSDSHVCCLLLSKYFTNHG